jgi:hypothetical protein
MTLPEGKAGCLLGLLIVATSLHAQSPGNEFFEKTIRPVLPANCYGCHSSKLKSPMGGLVLDTRTGMRTGGASGPIIATADPSGSLLLRALKYNDLQLKMPPTGKLPDAVIADFEQWIAAGAPDPRAETPGTPAPATNRVIDFEKGKQWWAFQPVKERPVPSVKSESWPKKKIDSFILAKLEKSGLTPSPEADPRVQIQRAYLDPGRLQTQLRRGGGLRQRRLAATIRKLGGPSARLTAPRRAMGPLLARRGPLRGRRRKSYGHWIFVRLALSRLRHPRSQ